MWRAGSQAHRSAPSPANTGAKAGSRSIFRHNSSRNTWRSIRWLLVIVLSRPLGAVVWLIDQRRPLLLTLPLHQRVEDLVQDERHLLQGGLLGGDRVLAHRGPELVDRLVESCP